MQPRRPAIGILVRFTGGYYFGAMLSGIRQIARAAGVPLLVIQSGLDQLRLPSFGADHVAGWIVLHPSADFLPKPIQIDQLLALLMTHLNLTWRYTEAEPIPDARSVGADQAALIPPPPEELATLFELATIGDLFGLQQRAIYLEQQNPQLGPFARRLGRLASQFEPEQILALIAQYLPPET